MWLILIVGRLMWRHRKSRLRTPWEYLSAKAVRVVLCAGGGCLLAATGNWYLVFFAWALALIALAW